MHRWVKNDPVRLFSCNIYVTKSCYHFIFQLLLKKLVIDIVPFKMLTYLSYILQNKTVLLLPQDSISGSKMTHINSYGVSFNSDQLWLIEIYILWTTQTISQVSHVKIIVHSNICYMKNVMQELGSISLCITHIPYAIAYMGRQPGEEIQKNLGENIIRQLCSAFRNTGCDITMDNVFTSVSLL